MAPRSERETAKNRSKLIKQLEDSHIVFSLPFAEIQFMPDTQNTFKSFDPVGLP